MRRKIKTVMEQMNAEKPDDVLADLEAKHGSQQRMVSCYVCKSPNAKHELREMSPRFGHFLCDDCKRKEDDANAAFRWLCS